jgi:hypothetical protein
VGSPSGSVLSAIRFSGAFTGRLGVLGFSLRISRIFGFWRVSRLVSFSIRPSRCFGGSFAIFTCRISNGTGR